MQQQNYDVMLSISKTYIWIDWNKQLALEHGFFLLLLFLDNKAKN